MSDEKRGEQVWAQIVESCMSGYGSSINVGSDIRRAAVLWANDQVYASRPAPPDDSAVVEALRAALADAGRRFATMGEHGCANDDIAKTELKRLATRCQALSTRHDNSPREEHDAIDQSDYDDIAAHDAQQQAPAEGGILALDRHCTDEPAAPVEDEARNGDEWPKWYMHKSVDTLICFKDAGTYGEVMIEQGHMYAHPVSVGRLWPEFMSNISSGYLPICPAAAGHYAAQHQQETKPTPELTGRRKRHNEMLCVRH